MICTYEMRTELLSRIGQEILWKDLKDGERFIVLQKGWGVDTQWSIDGQDLLAYIGDSPIRNYRYTAIGRINSYHKHKVRIVG